MEIDFSTIWQKNNLFFPQCNLVFFFLKNGGGGPQVLTSLILRISENVLYTVCQANKVKINTNKIPFVMKINSWNPTPKRINS